MRGDERARRAVVRRRLATGGVVAVFAVAGLLFATSAEIARGTQLRTDRTDLASVIRPRTPAQRRHAAGLADLRGEDRRPGGGGGRCELRGRRSPRPGRGDRSGRRSRPRSGQRLTVTTDDAPRDRQRPAGTTTDDLVVHQQDVQGVVNALWAGGAEAMMLMDQRVISTSAVRCVGNTLILQGRVYSPPFSDLRHR